MVYWPSNQQFRRYWPMSHRLGTNFISYLSIKLVSLKNIDIYSFFGLIMAHSSVILSPKSTFLYTKMIYSSSRFRCCQDLSSVTFLSKVAILCHFVPFCAIGATLGVRAQIWSQKLCLMYITCISSKTKVQNIWLPVRGEALLVSCS